MVQPSRRDAHHWRGTVSQSLVIAAAALRTNLSEAYLGAAHPDSGATRNLVARFTWAHRAAGHSAEQALNALRVIAAEASASHGGASSTPRVEQLLEWAMRAYFDTEPYGHSSLLP
jgi:hypothetical protein